MKANFIILSIVWLNLISGNILADSTIIKLSFYSNDGNCLEFYSTTEANLDESECKRINKFLRTILEEDLNVDTKPAFNIQDFVKPEKEVIENIIDTKAIFNEIINETYQGK